MGIDYMIHYPCVPKDTLGTDGILERLKNRERAEQVIQMYRNAGDNRSDSKIGFELTRRSANGDQYSEVVVAADLLQEAAILDEFAHHCQGCPANLTGKAYGCVGYINYPITTKGEVWLLEQLPSVADPILFIMLVRGIQEIGYSGQEARRLRDEPGVYFQNVDTLARRYTEMDVTADILFEMTFQLGPIQPPHAAMLLLFYHAIPRDDIDPGRIMALTRHELSPDQFQAQYPFLHEIKAEDDSSTQDLKRFLKALYVAYQLNVPVLLDV